MTPDPVRNRRTRSTAWLLLAVPVLVASSCSADKDGSSKGHGPSATSTTGTQPARTQGSDPSNGKPKSPTAVTVQLAPPETSSSTSTP